MARIVSGDSPQGMKKLPAEHGNDTERVREVATISALCTNCLSGCPDGMKKLPAERGNDTERVREVTIITALCTHYQPTLRA